MRIPAILAAAAAIAVVGAAEPANAENERCTIVGPLAVANFFRMLAEVSGGAVPGQATAGLNDLVSLYAAIGCDVAPLEATLDCAAERALAGGEINAGDVSRSCSDENGLPRP